MLTGTLPANTGVVVKADEGTYTFVQSSETPASIENNLLEGTLTRKQITKEGDKEYYVLDLYEAVGFYIAENNYFWNDANKAYLVISKGEANNNSYFLFDFGGTTSICEI